MFSSFPVECVLKFLTRKEAAKFARTNRYLRDEVKKNEFMVIVQGLWDVKHPEYNGWEDTEYFTTKTLAMERAEEHKKNPKVQLVNVYHYFAQIGWVANSPSFLVEWTREKKN